MAERVYTGPVPADTMPSLVAACQFTGPAYFLAEDLPRRAIAPNERAGLLSFAPFTPRLADKCAAFSSGRIFQEDRELRWERQGEQLHVVYVGEASEDQFAGLLHEPERPIELIPRPESEPTWYYLFGERLDQDDLDKMSSIARSGEFAVLRIPRILSYPVAQNGQDTRKYTRLGVREYLDPVTNRVILFRFARVEQYQA